MKCTLFFEPNIYGHRLEYLHSLYEYASTISHERFVFVVPSTFNNEKNKFQWPSASNIVIEIVDIKKSWLENKGRLSFAYNTILLSLLLRHYTKKHKATDVFLINLMAFYPAVSILLPKNVNISGIVYYIFLYDNLSEVQIKKNWRKYKEIAAKKNIKTVFMLNDAKSADILNTELSTDKFKRLADPIPIKDVTFQDLRKTYNISDDAIIFSHFGGLTARKGTLKILDAISLLDNKEKYVFFFAGKAYDDLSNVIHTKIDILREQGYQIYYKEGFVSYEYLSSLASGSDCILIPYSNTCQSSGALAYSAFYKTNVIGPSEGLLGELIQKYHLGVTVDEITPASIAEAILRFKPFAINDSYCKDNSKETFCKLILG